MKNISKFLILFLTINLFVGEIAHARSRMGRSFGRRGSRSFFQKKKTYKTNNFRKKIDAKPSQARQKSNFQNNAFNNRTPRSGGFMRSMMGAVAGTMIGGMIFRALGLNPATFGAGGSGFFFIILLLGVGVFFYMRSRRQTPQVASGAYYQNNSYEHQSSSEQTQANDRGDFINAAYDKFSSQKESDEAKPEADDLNYNDQSFINARNKDFFSIQHAWSKKDINGVKDLMTSEIYDEFVNEINEKNKNGITSTLENLMINSSQAVSSWHEDDGEYVTIHFQVSLIEYEKDQTGQIVSGSQSEYTDINEYWTYVKTHNESTWKLCALENTPS